jgi:hypothetical protein
MFQAFYLFQIEALFPPNCTRGTKPLLTRFERDSTALRGWGDWGNYK